MEKASPVEMRKSLVIVDSLKKGMIKFIPIPVLDEEDHGRLVDILSNRLYLIENFAEKPNSPACGTCWDQKEIAGPDMKLYKCPECSGPIADLE